jgi:hypothetical protein
MANYLLVYHGGSMPEGETEAARVMAAWDAWYQRLVDGGNPASATKVLSPDGTVADGGPTAPSGYTIIRADAHDAAVDLARGCPVLTAGGMVEVVETFDAM